MTNVELILEYRQLNRDIGKMKEQLVSCGDPDKTSHVYQALNGACARCNELEVTLFKIGRE